VTQNALPLALPESPADWHDWVASRCDSELERARTLVDDLKSGDAPAAGAALLSLWNDVGIALGNAGSIAGLMAQVHPDEAVRSRAESAEQDLQRFITEVGQDRDLFEVLSRIDASDLDDQAQRVLEKSLRDFRRAGVDQDDVTRSRLREISERSLALAQDFSRNIRDDVRSVLLHEDQLDGLPEDYIAAHPAESEGNVRITTDYPDYIPFMTFGRDRSARASLAREFLNRAWPDNDPLLVELLALRQEHARILGYEDWASFDAEVKMIGEGAAIPRFIDRISAASEKSAKRDYDILLARLQQDHPQVTQIDSADRSFYAEVLRREQFEVDAQQVRQYFDFTKVRQGLLEVTGRLFGLEYVPVADPATWDDEVAVYDVALDGEVLGRIHLDLHPREGKFKHAAQFSLVPGIRGRQLPEGVLVCNFSRGLMEHSDVVTLFHEFGHLVHHILAGRHEWLRFSGVATEWDFVEAPSQMLEEWAWDAAILQSFATDADGDAIPASLVERMRTAKEFGKGFQARTQMFYASVSYWLHRMVPSDPTAVVQEMQERYDSFAYVPDTHMHAAFGHLEGYTSAYYTYMWSLVIAKDLFSAFDPSNLFDPAVAQRYRDLILAPGGSRDAADLVAEFLGRPYTFDAFEAWLNQS
jgi:thimet oligopeptidase